MKLRMLLLAVAATALGVRAETWKGSCEISFTVTETMNRKFSGSGSGEEFAAEVKADGARQLASWTVAVKPANLSTKKDARDKEMWKMFRLAEFAEATGGVKGFDLAAARAAGEQPVELPFSLTLIGVTQELTATVSNVKSEEGAVSFDADFKVDMKSFTLKPKVLLGLFRVNNDVPVRASFTLKP